MARCLPGQPVDAGGRPGGQGGLGRVASGRCRLTATAPPGERSCLGGAQQGRASHVIGCWSWGRAGGLTHKKQLVYIAWRGACRGSRWRPGARHGWRINARCAAHGGGCRGERYGVPGASRGHVASAGLWLQGGIRISLPGRGWGAQAALRWSCWPAGGAACSGIYRLAVCGYRVVRTLARLRMAARRWDVQGHRDLGRGQRTRGRTGVALQGRGVKGRLLPPLSARVGTVGCGVRRHRDHDVPHT